MRAIANKAAGVGPWLYSMLLKILSFLYVIDTKILRRHFTSFFHTQASNARCVARLTQMLYFQWTWSVFKVRLQSKKMPLSPNALKLPNSSLKDQCLNLNSFK